LVSYGDDTDNCGTMRLQFDSGRGTLLRLSQINVLSSQVNAIFFTHMHNDHSEGFADLLTHRWLVFPASPKIDARHEADAGQEEIVAINRLRWVEFEYREMPASR